MDQIRTFLEHIPIRHDFASQIILLGVVQGFFLVMVIFLRASRDSAIRLYGWALLLQTLVCLDIYLCYTGLIKYPIVLNDSTEPLVLLIAPSLYFFLYALLKRKPVRLRIHWPHLLPALLYALSQIPYYLAPLEVKVNAYLVAYHEDMASMEVPEGFDYSYLMWKDRHRWMILLSFVLYFVLSIRILMRTPGGLGLGAWAKKGKYAFSRNTLIFFLCLLLVVLVIFLTFEDDGGDHIIGMAQTLTLFVTSVFIFAESRFFERSWLADKYETLPGDTIPFEAIEQLMGDPGYFTQQRLAIKSVADRLGTHPNAVSKLINTRTGMNFNEYVNQKRIELAKVRLLDGAFAHWTVEAIGQSVGFSSKSTFYTAFKKQQGLSPNAFIGQQRANKES